MWTSTSLIHACAASGFFSWPFICQRHSVSKDNLQLFAADSSSRHCGAGRYTGRTDRVRARRRVHVRVGMPSTEPQVRTPLAAMRHAPQRGTPGPQHPGVKGANTSPVAPEEPLRQPYWWHQLASQIFPSNRVIELAGPGAA